jgi:small subunit ribosomal protein S16
MAVRIRLSRFGRLHRPFYRIIAIDSRRHREGEASEVLGTYDPLLKDKNIVVDMDRVQAWIAQGALVSVALTSLLKHHGYPLAGKPAKAAKPAKAKAPAAKTPKKTYVPASRRAVKRHKATRKAAAAAAKAAAPAAPATEPAPQA